MKIKISFKNILILFLLFAGHASAQNLIVGQVIDKRTGLALEDVKISWWLGDAKKELTDEEGIFKIGIDSESSILLVERAGKKKQFLKADVATMDSLFWELNIVMEDQDISSSTASHWEQSVYEIPASTVIVDRDEIERNGYMTLQEILENVPGFYSIDHRSESDVTFGVRGFWAPFNRNVMIQVNGVSMFSDRQNDFPLNKINIPVESIERLEIVRGPMSVIYGAGAFFGVINIITLNPLGEEVSGSISSGWGTQNNFNQSFQYSLRKDGLILSLSAMNSVRDGFQQPWDAMISDKAYAADSTNFSTAAPFDTTTSFQYKGLIVNPERYSKKHQSLNFALRYNRFSANVNYARSDFGFSFLHPGPNDRNDYRSNTMNIQFGYGGETPVTKWKNRKEVQRQFSYEIKASHLFSLVDASYKYFLPNSYTPGEDRVATLRTEANTLWTIANNEKKNKSFVLSSGAAYTNNYQNASIYNAAEFGLRNWYIGLEPNTSLQTLAFYSQLDIKLQDLQFVIGTRLEQQRAYSMLSEYNVDLLFTDATSQPPGVDTTFYLPPTSILDTNSQNKRIIPIPRLAVLYKFAEKDNSAHYFRVMYSEAIMQSTVVDNASDVMSVFDEQNRQYLKPEKIGTFEIGYTYNFESEDYELRKKKELMLNINLFRNDLTDLVTRQIGFNSGNGSFATQSTNGDHFTTRGIELIANSTYGIPRTENQRSMSLHASTDMTYQRTIDFNDRDIEVSFSPDFLAGANVSFEIGDLIVQSKGLNMGSAIITVGMNYVGAMKAYYQSDTTDLSGNPIPPGYIGDDTDGYTRWSLNFRLNHIRFRQQTMNKSTAVSTGFYLNARITNLFNKEYFYPTYTLNSWADRGMLGRPRQILVTIGYKF